MLVLTLLAAQCTDVRVNSVMATLYRSKYKFPSDILNDGELNFRKNINSINFFINKAKYVLSLCRTLVGKYDGKVPETIEELSSLSGVGRKPASVVLENCFGRNDVIIVDIHLKHVAARLGLIENENSDKIEI